MHFPSLLPPSPNLSATHSFDFSYQSHCLFCFFFFFSRAEWSRTTTTAAATQSVISFVIVVAQLGTRAGGCNSRQRSKRSVGLPHRRRQQFLLGLYSPLVPGRPTCRTSAGSATPDPRQWLPLLWQGKWAVSVLRSGSFLTRGSRKRNSSRSNLIVCFKSWTRQLVCCFCFLYNCFCLFVSIVRLWLQPRAASLIWLKEKWEKKKSRRRNE